MSVGTELTYAEAIGNGSATVFPFTFTIPDDDYIRVFIRVIATGGDTVITPGNYTLYRNPAGGGTVTYPLSGSPLASTHKIYIERVMPYIQELDILNQGTFSPDSVENQFDLMEMQIQQLKDKVSNTIRTPLDVAQNELPALADGYLRFIGGQWTLATIGDSSITLHSEVVASVAAARALTSVGFPFTEFELLSWHAGLRMGGGVFQYDPADIVSADNSGTILVDASGRRWKRLVWDGVLTPQHFGAKGDGSTSDNTAWTAYEAATVSTELSDGKTYNLTAGQFPAQLVSGRGKMAIAGTTLDGFALGFDVKRTNIVSVPENYAKKILGRTSNPAGETNYFNVILSPHSNAGDTTKAIWRNVLLGNGVGEYLTSLERCVGVGDGVFRFAKYAERSNGVGSLNMQWLGQTITLAADANYWYHDFFTEAQLPGVVGWDFHSLETNNPGVGAAIAAFSSWSSDTSTAARNDAFGRDALLHVVKGVNNVAFGYRALADLYEGNDNTAIGKDCFYGGVWLDEQTGLGSRCGELLQEGSGSVLIGSRAALDLVSSTTSVLIGTLTAGTYWSTLRCVFIGGGSGQSIYDKAISAINLGTSTVTATAHGLSNGTKVYIREIVGTVELNNRHFLIAGATANTFTLQTLAGVAVNMAAYTAYVSGGTVNPSVVSDILAIQNLYTRAPLIGGDFATAKVVLGLGKPSFAQGTVTVVTANVAAGSANAAADELVLVNNGNAGLTILTGNADVGGIYFADDTQNQAGGLNYDHATDRLTFRAGNAARAYITSAGNLKIAGTAVRGTTEGTNHLDIFDGAAPVGTLTDGISLYSTAGELRVMDAAGNATLLSPHDRKTNEWIYDSVDTRTGRRLRIDMERMLKMLNEVFGWNFIHETGV